MSPRPLRNLASLTITLSLALGAAVRTEARPWTNLEGVTIEADLVSVTENAVVLQLTDGRRATYPLEKLVEPDRAFARAEFARLAAAREKAQSQPPSATARTLPEKITLTTPELAKIPHPADNATPQLKKYIITLLAYDPYLRDRDRGDQTGMQERDQLLANLGESNLDLLIEQLSSDPDSYSTGQFAALNAIARLATDNSKDLILRAYAKNHQLAIAISRKGWGTEAENITLQHLKKMPEWRGWSSAHIDFTALCLSAERPELWNEFQRFAQKQSSSTITGILSNLDYRRDLPAITKERMDALYKITWASTKSNAGIDDIRLANLMVEKGDLDALKLIAKLLATGSSSPRYSQRYLETQLKRSRGLVISLTDAPAGTDAELSQWLRQNLPSLAWDVAKGRFVKK